MATPLGHMRRALPDAELARLAGGGDGEAFAELYGRHEQRVYGFCMRMLGTPHDAAEATQDTFVRMLGRLPALQGRELNFIAYTLTAARNACYDMIGSRRTVEPVAEDPEPSGPQEGQLERDPERRALLEATREQVKAANAALPERQREVLALRELEGLSYEEIGELMGMSRNAVAQLISRARIKLGDLLRGGALESVSAGSPECERALPLLAALQDTQEDEEGPLAWAQAHLESCERCRVSRAAMEEAGVSYRALGPIVVPAWLLHATIAHAAEAVGADWSHLTSTLHGAGATSSAGAPQHPGAGGAGSSSGGGSGSNSGSPGSGTGSSGTGETGRLRSTAPSTPRAPTQTVTPADPAAGALVGSSIWLWVKRPGAPGRRTAGVLLAALLCAIVVLVATGDLARESRVPAHTLTLLAPPATPAATFAVHRHRPVGTPTPHLHRPSLAGASKVSTTPAPPTALNHSGIAGKRVVHTHAKHRSRPPRHRPPPAQQHAPASTTPTPVTVPAQPAPPPATTPTTTTTPAQTTTTTTTTPTSTETTGTTTTEQPRDTNPGEPSEPGGGGGGLIP
jgi:RNA polymerase sigma factor (sigma-70 family)